jgi:hypothetical protein
MRVTDDGVHWVSSLDTGHQIETERLYWSVLQEIANGEDPFGEPS